MFCKLPIQHFILQQALGQCKVYMNGVMEYMKCISKIMKYKKVQLQSQISHINQQHKGQREIMNELHITRDKTKASEQRLNIK